MTLYLYCHLWIVVSHSFDYQVALWLEPLPEPELTLVPATVAVFVSKSVTELALLLS